MRQNEKDSRHKACLLSFQRVKKVHIQQQPGASPV